MNLGRPSWLGGWRFWLVVVLVALALFVFFFVAFGRGEGEPAEPPAATGLNQEAGMYVGGRRALARGP